ncbi:hypothetical protein [Bosea sp. Root381]|uniref:hypothetical protein n=1 Tax=Bosea sp. Root381 TaxID=1736524 RepID=UPI0012E32E94|nr:hypothetical protein [Bosea sp. Root381]
MSAPQPPALQWITFAVAALGTIGTLAGIWLTNHFNGRRQKRERLWDLKREAYANLIEAFDENRYIQKIINKIDWTDEQAGLARITALTETIEAERRKMRSVKSRNLFLLNGRAKAAIATFDALHVELEPLLFGPEADYTAYFNRSKEAFEVAIAELTAAAADELG